MKLKMMSMAALMVLLLSCGTTTNTTTSTNAAYAVPDNISTRFSYQYPQATNVTWGAYDATVVPIDWELAGWNTLDKDDYVVQFDLGGERYYAWYDNNGEWIGSAYALNDVSRLPAAVNSTINSQFAGYTIESVQREMWKDKMAYEVKLKSGDNKVKLLVDANGTVLKQKTKVDD